MTKTDVAPHVPSTFLHPTAIQSITDKDPNTQALMDEAKSDIKSDIKSETKSQMKQIPSVSQPIDEPSTSTPDPTANAQLDSKSNVSSDQNHLAVEPSPPQLKRVISHGRSIQMTGQSLEELDKGELIYLRVFLSSTFRDMMDERNALITRTFPELREICENRGITVTEVDLRWGITIQESQNGRAITLCLEEITNSQYFVCFLGDRYGWVPNRTDPSQYNPELQTSHAWLDNFLDISVTEMEIRYAALNHNAIAQRSLFYFRRPDPRGVDEPAICAEKQRLLKAEISTRFPVKVFATGLELAQHVLDDMKESLKMDFPRHYETMDGATLEQIAHSQFGLSRLEVFHGQHSIISAILDYAESTSLKPFVIQAPPGLGKSSVLAKAHSLLPKETTFIHFVGCTSESVQLEFMLLRILKALSIPLPSSEEDVVGTFTQLLKKHYKSTQRRVLFIDAVNQLENDESRPYELKWLPHLLPSNLGVVISCISEHDAVKVMIDRHWTIASLDYPDVVSVDKTVVDYLSKFSKRLVEEQKSKLLHSQSCRHPLFLRVALDELRIFGNFEHLTQKIETIISNANVTELYTSIITRWLTDFTPAAHPNIVIDTLCAIAVSRAGLKETELLQFVDAPRVDWSPFFVGLKNSLFLQHGRYTFAHQQLCEAVFLRFFSMEHQDKKEFKQQIHLRLGNYFVSSLPNIDEDEMVEAAYQFSCGELYKELRAFLTHPSVTDVLLATNWRLELLQHWRNLEAHGFDPVQEYNALLQDSWSKHRAMRVAKLYTGLGRIQDAMILYETIVDEEERLDIANRTPAVYNDLATLYKKNGEFTKARHMYELTLEIISERETGNLNRDEMIAIARDNLALVVQELGDYAAAEQIFLEALALRESSLGPQHPDVGNSYNNLALLASKHQDYDRAREYYEKAFIIMETCYGREHINTVTIQSNIGSMLFKQGKGQEALTELTAAHEVLEKIYGAEHPDVASVLDNMGLAHRLLGKLESALECHKRALAVYESVYGSQHHTLSTPLCNLAMLLKDNKQYAKAEELYLRALHIDQMMYGPNHDNVATIMTNLGSLLVAQGKQREAKEYLERSHSIRRQSLLTGGKSLIKSLMDMASVNAKMKNNDEAIRLYTEVVNKIDPNDPKMQQTLADVLHNLGVLEYDMQRDTEALAWFEKAYILEAVVYGKEHEITRETFGFIDELQNPE
eukprot:TRINITY_DN3252_c1_g1_i1.p1 TRINITY_DN3252_c1_g1~~TRINITY_DN3252_c1_g1_i1.p1  ORF type:complete len:1379 (-),score=386.10 TRINITY_DN3252_c1_g1_i1:417-4013(-)